MEKLLIYQREISKDLITSKRAKNNISLKFSKIISYLNFRLIKILENISVILQQEDILNSEVKVLG